MSQDNEGSIPDYPQHQAWLDKQRAGLEAQSTKARDSVTRQVTQWERTESESARDQTDQNPPATEE